MLWEAIGIMCMNALLLGLGIAGLYYVLNMVWHVIQAARHMRRLARLADDRVAPRPRVMDLEPLRRQWARRSVEDSSRPQDKAAIAPPLAPYRYDEEGT